MIINKNSLILLALTLAVLLVGTIIEDNLAILITGSIYIVLGFLFSVYLSTKQSGDSVVLFFLFFLFYLIHMSSVHFVLEYFYGRPNIASDEIWFYASSNNIITYLKSGYSLFDVANINQYQELSAYIYLTGHLGIFANEIGENSVLIQKLLIVFFASLIPVVLYNILRVYVENKIAIYATVVYGLFTYITHDSAMILRDIPVALTYIIVFWIIFQKISVINILLLLFILFLSYFLRVETGIFLMGMTTVYLLYAFDQIIKNKFVKIFIFILVGFAGIFLVFALGLSDMFLDLYTNVTKSGAKQASADSLGIKLASLPYGLGVIGLALFGQIQPFPAWMVFREFGALLLFSMISGITWFIVWGYLVYGIVKIKILQFIDIKLKLLFYFSLLYIVMLANAELVTRRLMAVYPIIFLLSVLSFISISKEKRIKIFVFALLVYLSLITVFLYLKL